MLPFFNIELAACSNYPDRADNAMTWAPIRQASRSFLSLPGTTGFVTTIDLGMANGAVHSTVKQPDGRRLALQVLREVYGHPVTAAGPSLAGHSTGGAGYQISTTTDPTTGIAIASVPMPFHNAYNLHAAPAAGFHSGCEESPFEFGWVEVNSGKTFWLHANFSVAQLDGNTGSSSSS